MGCGRSGQTDSRLFVLRNPPTRSPTFLNHHIYPLNIMPTPVLVHCDSVRNMCSSIPVLQIYEFMYTALHSSNSRFSGRVDRQQKKYSTHFHLRSTVNDADWRIFVQRKNMHRDFSEERRHKFWDGLYVHKSYNADLYCANNWAR